MRIKLLVLTILFLFFGVRPAFASHVVINELYYDVDSTHGQETNNEWIELFNISTSDVDLTGWTITDNSSSRTLASVIIKANSTLVIAAQSSTWNFWNITGDKIALNANLGNGLSNDGDKLLLKDNGGVEHDKLSYGSNSDYQPSLPDVNEGRSLERIPAGSAFVDQSNPTPGVISVSIFSPTPTPSSSPSSSPAPTSTSSSSTSTFTISNTPSQIDSTETFNVAVNVSLSSKPNTTFYLKGAFKKTDSSNYFGLTNVSGNWIKNSSSYSSQYAITTNSSGNWSGNLEVKPDSEDSGFTGTGDYIFKIGRYNATDTNPSVSWSDNESTIKIIFTGSDQGETLTDVSSPTTNPSTSPATVKTSTSNQPKSYDTLVYRIASVAAATTSATPSNITDVKNQKQTNPFVWVGLIFIFAGAGAIGYIYLKKNEKLHFPFGR